MSILNTLINHSCKIILVIVGLALAVLPIIHLFAHQKLHHQGWNPAFEKYQHRINEIQDASALQFAYVFQNNSTQKSLATQIQDTLELADFVSYTLIQAGKPVVRKNLEIKIKRKTKKSQEVQTPQSVATVTTLVQNPPLAFLKKEVAKYINFDHESLKSKHWVIVSFGEVQTRIIQEIEAIKESNPQYKFIIVSPRQITPLSIETSDSKAETEKIAQELQQKEKSKKKKTKVKKVKVVEEEAEKPVEQTQQENAIQENDL